MKYRKILLILAIATLSLTACKKEQNPAPAETTAIEETAVEKETTEIEDAETKEAENIDTTEIEAETTSENISVETADTTETQGALDPSNIIVNEDGTYSFTDEFLIAVQSINGAAGLTEENLNKMLQEVAPNLVGLAELGMCTEADVIGIIESYIGMYEYDQAVEQQKPQQNQNQQKPSGGTSQNNGGGNNNQEPSGGNSEPTYSGGDNAAGPGAMDDVIAGLLQEGTGTDHQHGEGDGTHVGISH